jgi:hypothetical protein
MFLRTIFYYNRCLVNVVSHESPIIITLLHAILHPSHHLLNVLLQIANKLGLSKKNSKSFRKPVRDCRVLEKCCFIPMYFHSNGMRNAFFSRVISSAVNVGPNIQYMAIGYGEVKILIFLHYLIDPATPGKLSGQNCDLNALFVLRSISKQLTRSCFIH